MSTHWVQEPARQTSIYGEFDVVVLGAGPAGMAASVSAARHGTRTLLVERYGFLGGMGTAGGVTNFAGLYGKRRGQMQQLVHGVVDELLMRMGAAGGLNAPQDGMGGRIRVCSYDTSIYKCVADQWLQAAGVQLLFHAQACGVVKHDDDNVHALIVETKSGRQAIRAHSFIDCSGDADLATWAGENLAVGDGQGSGLFPSTMFRIGGVDAPLALAAVGEFGAINRFMAEAQARKPGAYRFARNGAILRPQKDPSEWRANITQICNAQGLAMNGVDAQQLSDGEQEGRWQIAEYMRFLQAEVPGFENARIVEIAPQVGLRETRRLCGLYQLSGSDIENSTRFEDGIGLNAWPMELHLQGRIEWVFPKDEFNSFNHLPWRMLLAPRTPNLLVAGRCASMTHEGQSAARASGACFVMGQAAGTAAAMRGTSAFAELPVSPLQYTLMQDGAELDL